MQSLEHREPRRKASRERLEDDEGNREAELYPWQEKRR
jgi:hypothetical protein